MTAVRKYFAYGSNMNVERVAERELKVAHACAAKLSNYRMVFDKVSKHHPGISHANIIFAPGSIVEGVLYWLESDVEILKMDVFETAPINYGREVIMVEMSQADRAEATARGLEDSTLEAPTLENPTLKDCMTWTWTYFANPAVRALDHLPTQDYLDHLLAGKPFLSAAYYEALRAQPVVTP